MPSIDMDHDKGTDYSDYRYQTIGAQAQIQGPNINGDEAEVRFIQNAEPMEGRGGLANNEVAELVAYDIFVKTAYFEDIGDNNVPNNVVLFGGFGMNLSPDAENADPNRGGNAEIFEETNADGQVFGRAEVDDRVLDYFEHTSVMTFSDAATGVSGAGSIEPGYNKTQNFRELTGRGPVLDSTDDMSIVGILEVEQDTDQTILGKVEAQCVWDVAEVSDAGRAFSVPTDD